MFKQKILVLLVVPASFAMAQDGGKAILQKAAIAMGAANLKSIQYSGSGKAGTLGQSYTPQTAWPTVNVTSYSRTIDFESQSSKEEMVRTLENPPAKGGGAPFQGEQKQVNLVAGLYAWNQPGAAPVPANAALEERQLQLMSTPQGFLKQALITNTMAKKVKGGSEVSFSEFGRFKVTGVRFMPFSSARGSGWQPSRDRRNDVVACSWQNLLSGYTNPNEAVFEIRLKQNTSYTSR